MKRLIIIFLLIGISAYYILAQSPKKYSAQEIKNDLEYLRNALEASHYDFYALTSKAILDSTYNQIMSIIKK